MGTSSSKIAWGKPPEVKLPASPQLAALASAVAESLRPPPRWRVSEWATERRILGQGSSAPGPWSNDPVPYLVEIMDSLSPHDPTETVVLMKSARCGGTEAVNNAVGCWADIDPGPIMWVSPTIELAEEWSKDTLDHLIDSTPSLRRKFVRGKRMGNAVRFKRYAGGSVRVAGGQSGAAFRNRTIRYLVLDDADGFAPLATGEGDVFALAIKRTETFPGRRKIFINSTPTEKSTSRIWREWERSDQRRYHVPCPHCGVFQWLRWGEPGTGSPGIKYDKDDLDAGVWYECEACHGRIEEEHRRGMNALGQWVASAPGAGRPRGYHLSALYSPFVAWVDLARQWLKANRSNDAGELQVFVNTVLGEPWDDIGTERVDPSALYARREPYGDPSGADGFPSAPSGVSLITAGVDVQGDRLELEVVGWGAGEESWSIDYRVLYGDPTDPELWALLDNILTHRWARDGGGSLPIMAACVDTGYKLQSVADYCRPRFGRRVWAIKGTPGKRPVWPRRPSKSDIGKITLYNIGVDAAKDVIYSRLRITRPEDAAPGAPVPGMCHFPARDDYDEPYFDGMTCEVKRIRYHSGFAHAYWDKPPGARNEPLDCRVYAYAALCGLKSMGVKIDTAAEPRHAAPQQRSPAKPAKPDWFGNGGRSAQRNKGKAWL